MTDSCLHCRHAFREIAGIFQSEVLAMARH
jgi:hypothetical protein